MMLDLPHALEYLQGDKPLLGEFLVLFSKTVSELRPLLDMALKQVPAATSQASWNTFYRALHGAKPAIQVVAAPTVRQTVESLCQALSTGQQSDTERLAGLLVPQLGRLEQEVAHAVAAGV